MSKFWQLSKFWHRSSGDLNDVLIDPAEDWSLSRWSRDHFRSRELTFDGFPRLNFEIAASGRPRIQIFSNWFVKKFKKLMEKWFDPMNRDDFLRWFSLCPRFFDSSNWGPNYIEFSKNPKIRKFEKIDYGADQELYKEEDGCDYTERGVDLVLGRNQDI